MDAWAILGLHQDFFRNLLAIAKLLRETVERPRRDLRAIYVHPLYLRASWGFAGKSCRINLHRQEHRGKGRTAASARRVYHAADQRGGPESQ